MADTTNAARVTFVTDQVGEQCQKLFFQFLDQFKVNGKQKYAAQVQNLAKSEKNTVRIRFSDVDTFKPDLAAAILSEYYRVNPFLCSAVRQFAEEKLQLKITKDVFISFVDVSVKRKLRELGTAQVGKLLQITGQVVRTHPVHPELVSGTFLCLECQTVVGNVEQQFKYTQPPVCRNQVCANRANFELIPHRSKFVDFQKVRIQETQAELPRGSIPRSLEVILRAEAVESCQPGDKCGFIGTLIVVPHVAALIGPGVATESGRPGRTADGNEATDGGVRGLKALGTRDLSYRLAFLACAVVPSAENKTSSYWNTVLHRSANDLDDPDVDPDETAENLDESLSSSAGNQANSAKRINELAIATMKKQLSDAEWARIYAMSRDPRIYSNLCASLFPSVHGNEEVKQGIVLMLFGGVPKQTPDGTRLRGDINVCLVGDPSTAKSQFLKQVEAFCPRAIYTSGKASSAAGLTAAVVRDEETFEFVIEAGALILADNGVCCIDEFDKMELRDQVAIHEALEQQTISITKAGVKATLNARTSVLAAANPIGGRYDRSKPLKFNINLSEPIKSRFDLFFVLIDECNEVTDYAIASKIVLQHKSKTQPTIAAAQRTQSESMYSAEEIARYIAFARQFRPRIGRDAMRLLVEYYKSMRTREATQVYGGRAAGGAFGLASGATACRVTVRQLESLIRLSEGLAKLYFADQVSPAHVREAYRLLNKSIIRVEQPDIQLEDDSALPDVPLMELAPEADRPAADARNDAEAPAAGLFMDLDDNLNRSGDEDLLSRGDAATKQKQAAKAKLAGPTRQVRIGFDEYKRLATMLIIRIRKLEEELELLEEIEAPRSQIDETLIRMRREELVNWYLREVESEIGDERELIERKLVIDKVIERLVKHDNVLLELRGGAKLPAGLQSDAAPMHTDAEENPLLIVHPNYSLD